MGPDPAVSVVVPVYNPGPAIEPLIDSLAAQSLPAEAFEAVFVDDGSTDGTPARLDRLAAERANVTVIHQENSGWPGKPRNVGTDAARGEYVFYSDNDDWLGPEALERMYAAASRTGADVLLAKMAGHRRQVPRELFRRNVDDAKVPGTPLFDGLTPHKMFRRAFLAEAAIRFPEGRRRLEDHVFVTRAYLLAHRVTVLADYVCYHHITREDTANAAFFPVDPGDYYGYVRETLDLLDELDAPEEYRRALVTRSLRVEMLGRLESRRYLDYVPEQQHALFDEVRRIVLERVPEPYDARLPARLQPLAAAVRGGDFDAGLRQTAWIAGVRGETVLADAAWEGDSLRLAWSARLRSGDGAVLAPAGDGWRLGGEGQVPADPAKLKVDVVARTRDRQYEVLLAADWTRQVEPDGTVLVEGSAQLPAGARPDGEPLTDGIWDVSVWVRGWGWSPELRLGATRTPAATAGAVPALAGDPGRYAQPYWTKGFGNLSLDLGAGPAAVARRLPAAQVRVGTAGLLRPTVTVALPLHAGLPRPVGLRLLPRDGTAAVGPLPARLLPATTGSRLVARAVPLGPRGGWDLELVLPGAGTTSTALRLPVPLTAPVGRAVRAARRWARRRLRAARRAVPAVRR